VYDPVGNLASETYGNGKSKRVSHNAVNQPISVNYDDGSEVLFAYDKNGNKVTLTDRFGTTSYGYDGLNRLTQITRFDRKIVDYGYDGVGNRTSLTYPDGRSIQYEYDGSERPIAVFDGGGKRTSYVYDQAERLVSTTLPNGIQTIYSYDAASRLLQVLNASRSRVISSFDYQLDRVGNRIQIASIRDGISTYTYDSLNQLTAWSDGWGHAVTYSYDELGNRTKRTTKERIELYAYDDADELISAGPSTFTYDGSGNRLTKTFFDTTTSYTWDSANRLKSVRSRSQNIQYQYDGDGNRIGKDTDYEYHSYVNDVWRRAPEVITDYRGEMPTDYVHGYALIAAVAGNDADYVDYDGLGSAVNTSESNGSVRASFSYDPWGNSASFGDRASDASDEAEPNISIRFAGQTLDRADNLYYLRARYYDPGIGRFLSGDPIGARLGSPNDQNRYIYARNNPIRYVDPLGLSSEGSTIAQDFASSTSSALSGLGAFAGLAVRGPTTQTEKTIVATGATAAAVLYVAPEVVEYCTFEAGNCAAIAQAAVELSTHQTTGLYGITTGAENWTQIGAMAVQAAIENVDKLENLLGPTDSGGSWNPGPDSGPIFYPDPLDPSGVSDSNPNINSDVDDSEQQQ